MPDPLADVEACKALQSRLADERRIIEDFRGALIAWQTCVEHAPLYTPEQTRKRREAVLDARARYESIRALTPEEAAALLAVESAVSRPWHRETTRERVEAVCRALRRVLGVG